MLSVLNLSSIRLAIESLEGAMFMVKVDFVQLFVFAIMVSMVAEYFVHQHFFLRLESWFQASHRLWYRFFFCRFCFIGKLAMVLAIWIRPVMFVEAAPYPIWTLAEWLINWLVLNFVALALDGIILQNALSVIYDRQKKEYELVEKFRENGVWKGIK